MIDTWVKSRFFIPVALTAGFIAVSYGLIASAPVNKRTKAVYVAPTVEVIDFKENSHVVTVQAQGLVGPARQEVVLSPQVGGKIMAVHGGFVPGGMIPAGETILEIEAIDYQLAVQEAKAKLDRAMASVELEKGLQQIAKEEFELLESDFAFDEASKALALRKPQLKQFQAEQAIAKNAYDRAVLSLRRTKLSLPFDALVLETDAAEGEIVSAGSSTGKFARADAFWVELRIQQKHLSRLKVRSDDKAGSSVIIRSNGYLYEGEVVGLRANLVSATRMGGAIVEVANEALLSGNPETPSLLIGSHVQAVLDAGSIDGALEIPRSALLDNEKLYVADAAGKLQIRSANVLWEMPDSLIIQPNFEAGDRLVVSRVAGVAPGTEVRTKAPAARLVGRVTIPNIADSKNAGR